MTMRSRAGAALVLGITSCVVVAVPGTASAHARLMSSSPAAGSQVRGAVRAVVLRFDDPVALLPRAVVLTTGAGARLATGPPRVVAGKRLAVPLRRRLPPGGYLVSWRVLADDGHVETGRFGFTVVGSTGAAGSALAPGAPATPGQPAWPVAVASALAVLAGVAAFVVVRRGMIAARALADAYPGGSRDASTTKDASRSPGGATPPGG